MLLARVRLRVATSKTLELLFGPLVVALPVQLSPPLSTTAAPLGSMICELQKMSVPVPLASVRWLPSAGFQTS